MSETYKPEAPAHRHPADKHGPGEHAEHSAVPYFVVWIVLCGLTLLTVMTGKQHLGAIALPLALTIATIKSLLVLAFFMHLWEQKGVPRLVIGMSVVFALVLMFFTMADVSTRFAPLTPKDAPFGAKVVMPPEKLVDPPEPRASPF